MWDFEERPMGFRSDRPCTCVGYNTRNAPGTKILWVDVVSFMVCLNGLELKYAGIIKTVMQRRSPQTIFEASSEYIKSQYLFLFWGVHVFISIGVVCV